MKIFPGRLFIFSLPFFSYFILLAIYNYHLDPFGVIKGDLILQKTEPNQRYLKAKHITNNPEKYNSFLFGSSRVGKIDINKINDSNTWYNYSYSESLPAENLKDIVLLLKSKVKINNILIGLDEFSFLVCPELHKNQSLRKPYKSIFNPFFDFLFLEPSISMYDKIKNADKSIYFTSGVYNTLYETGCFFENKKDKFIEENKEIHVNDSIFLKPYWQPYYNDRVDLALEDLINIYKICEENNINVKFFINPIHVTTYLKIDEELLFRFLTGLSEITEYNDFSGINAITTNNYYYYETSHYRPITGDKIIDNIFNPATNHQFGIIINSNNINSIIKTKKTENNEYKAGTSNYDINQSAGKVIDPKLELVLNEK